MAARFSGARVLVTSADLYMGPAISDRFRGEGATVIEDAGRYLADEDEPRRVVEGAGEIDILVLNLIPAQMVRGPAQAATDAGWRSMFEAMVHPTMRFTRAVLPQMIERRQGKIIVITSAAPLRGVPEMSDYTAARGAQNAYVLSVGAEVAQHNIQINAVAQNFVYGGYPVDAMSNPAIRERVMRDVPARRIAEGREQAELVLFLASQESNFLCGQIFPFAGGWVT